MHSWGPGPEISRRFEQRYGVKTKWIDSGDAGLIVERLRFGEPQQKIDVVLGIDQLTMAESRRLVRWKDLSSIKAKWIKDLPSEALQRDFIPFDWAPLAFIYRQGEIDPPQNMEDLADNKYDKSLSLQDPRTSTPGLQFLYWILTEKGFNEGFRYLEKISPSVHSVSSSWSSSYGLFKKGQAQMTFSYMTSPIYHLVEEKNDQYRAATLQQAHPYQVEYVGIPSTCQKCDLAKNFVRFLLEPVIQKIIMQKNYMLPTVANIKEGTPFAKIKSVPLQSLNEKLFALDRRHLLEKWKKVGM